MQTVSPKLFLLGVFIIPFLLGTGSAQAADAAQKALEAKGEAAFSLLKDDAFVRKWPAEKRFTSEEEADQAVDEGNRAIDAVDDALSDARAYCNTKFLVNACYDDARKLSFERKREIRRVIVAAEEFKRDLRTQAIEKRRAEAQAEPPREPVRLSPKTVKTDRPEPVDLAPKTVKPAPEPVELAPKEVKPAKAPSSLNRSSSAEAAAEREAAGPEAAAQAEADRAAQEAANERWYADKQAKAERRMKEAQARAEKRREQREAKQQKFEENLAEREAAQKRYEERQTKKESGLAKYF